MASSKVSGKSRGKAQTQAARRGPGRPRRDVAGGNEVSRLTGQPRKPGDSSSEKSQVTRGNGSKRAPGRAKAPGRVVAVGVDVPRLDELAAEAEARKTVEDEAKREGPGRPDEYHPRYAYLLRVDSGVRRETGKE